MKQFLSVVVLLLGGPETPIIPEHGYEALDHLASSLEAMLDPQETSTSGGPSASAPSSSASATATLPMDDALAKALEAATNSAPVSARPKQCDERKVEGGAGNYKEYLEKHHGGQKPKRGKTSQAAKPVKSKAQPTKRRRVHGKKPQVLGKVLSLSHCPYATQIFPSLQSLPRSLRFWETYLDPSGFGGFFISCLLNALWKRGSVAFSPCLLIMLWAG